MKHIKLFSLVGSFAENKDIAQKVRIKELIPSLKKGENVILDFENIDSTTQSFIHALISDLFRIFGANILDKVSFKNCSDVVRKVIEIVTDYMQES